MTGPKPDTPEYWAMVRRVVDKAPPFTEHQKRRLAVLLRPVDPKYRGQKPAA